MTTDIAAAACFALAIGHTFAVGNFARWSSRFATGSPAQRALRLLGEVELAFAFWALLFLGFLLAREGVVPAVEFVRARSFVEPLFVFVIIAVCSSEPILVVAQSAISRIARALPLRGGLPFYASALVVGPLLGSLITEPAAMTVTAFLLLGRFFSTTTSLRLKYATLGLLFVNVSIGGTLTPYAAPPILMVAREWGWDLNFMLTHFGWKGALACALSTALVAFLNRRELSAIPEPAPQPASMPNWLIAVHLLFLGLVVVAAHTPVALATLFVVFMGFTIATPTQQDRPHLREGLLVALFLGGLILLGAPQRWWLEPLLTKLDALPLYLGAMSLTAITDNAALTYLGSQVPSLNEASRYALVAGAVVGGGLTIIANAPNPAGCAILSKSFGETGIRPFALFRAALLPTLIAALIFWFA